MIGFSIRIHKSWLAAGPSVLKLFLDDEGTYALWQGDNDPKKWKLQKFYRQKLNYIHENPVRKAYVASPEHWLWSSANPATSLAIMLFAG